MQRKVHLSPLTLNNMRTSELETFPRAQSTNHARREIRDSCLFSTRLCSTQCFESAVVCAPLFTLPITLARLYIEPSCTPCVSECLDDRGGPSLSRFLHTRFQVSSPRRRVSRLSDGLFPHALSGMLEFDRLPPHLVLHAKLRSPITPHVSTGWMLGLSRFRNRSPTVNRRLDLFRNKSVAKPCLPDRTYPLASAFKVPGVTQRTTKKAPSAPPGHNGTLPWRPRQHHGDQ